MYSHLPQYVANVVDFLTSDEVYPKVTSFGGPTADPVISIDGKKFIQMSSPNYLGLANHPAVNEAAINAIQSDNPASLHYGDGINAWRKGEYQNLPFAKHRIEQHYRKVMFLSPDHVEINEKD